MRWVRHWLGSALVLLIGSFTGCAAKQSNPTTESQVRSAVDVPDHFLTDTATGATEPGPGEGCHNPLIDPRNGARLMLIRSADGRGDYDIQPPRYGLKADELLQVECASGRAVGIVKR
jgi:hypothetical protein